jgi:MOSC domain-containing protein YiiM
MPLETLQVLNAEGWPIRAGDIGENITTVGLPYDEFAPGKVYTVGAAELQISRACDPCDNLFLLPYVGKARGAEFLKTMLGRRGWYARVRREGVVRRGDQIALAALRPDVDAL